MRKSLKKIDPKRFSERLALLTEALDFFLTPEQKKKVYKLTPQDIIASTEKRKKISVSLPYFRMFRLFAVKSLYHGGLFNVI